MRRKKIVRDIVGHLPSVVRKPLIRRITRFPETLSGEFRFKLAETRDELEQAFSLLHDAYVQEGFMSPHASGLRVTKYHALPSTSTLVALKGDRVMGTVSLVRQNPFGLPLSTIFDLGGLPATARVAEASSLAIARDARHLRGRILFPLFKFMYHYAFDYFGVTHLAIAVNPKWYPFYEAMLLFERLAAKSVDAYGFVNGAPAVGAILDLQRFLFKCIHVYHGRRGQRDLSRFFLDLAPVNMEFPLRKRGVISDPVLSPEIMKYFFRERTKTFECLTDRERTVLRELYDAAEYLRLIPRPKVTELRCRSEKRFETRLAGRVPLESGGSVRVEIRDVSAGGLGGVAATALSGDTCAIQLDLEDHEPCTLAGLVVHSDDRGRFGIALDHSRGSGSRVRWFDFIAGLESRLMSAPAEAILLP